MSADTKAGDPGTRADVMSPRPVQGDVIAAYESMLDQVPDAGGEGMEGILSQIAMAQTVADLDAPWNQNGLGRFADWVLVVRAIHKMPSDYPGNLPWYLILDAVVRDTGEHVTVTTGSVSVVAQLVKAWSMGAFPISVIPRLAKRPTKDGYFPMHLEILA